MHLAIIRSPWSTLFIKKKGEFTLCEESYLVGEDWPSDEEVERERPFEDSYELLFDSFANILVI